MKLNDELLGAINKTKTNQRICALF